MKTSGYLWRSVAVLVVALASFPALALLGYMSGGGGGGMLALFLVLPVTLLGLGAYWIWLTRKHIREVELPLHYQIPLYAALIGAAQAIVIFPVLISGNAPAFGMPLAESFRFVVDPFLPLFMLFLMVSFLAATPLTTSGRHDLRYSRWTLGITAYLILCLAPHFAWPIGRLWPGNPFSIQRIASFGMPPTIPAVLALFALAFILKRQSRQWRSAEDQGDQVLV